MTKQRKTVNVSIQKRNFDKINDILNSWEEDGCNISNKICEAILFKESTKENPHILTILSTLNLIESSLKAKCDLSEEELSLNATEIFKEVLTLNIDGAKLTSFLTGNSALIRKNDKNIQDNNACNSDTDNNNTDKNADNNNADDTDNICKSNLKNTTESIEENQYNNNETCLSAITDNTEVASINHNIKNTNTSLETPNIKNDAPNMIVWTNFPDDKNLNNKENKDLNDILGAFICNN